MGTSRLQGELWGANPKAWAELQEPTARPLWTAMIDASAIGPGLDVLDAGCGAGGALRIAKARGANVFGVDASKALLDVARAAVDGTFVEGDLEELPFPDARFDVVLATNSLQYTADRTRAAGELARVKKPSGVVVVGMWAEPEKNEMSGLFAELRKLAPPPAGAPQPLDLSQRGNLVELLRGAGLTIERDAEVACVFAYKDADEYLLAQRSAGPLEATARSTNEDAVRSTLLRYAVPFTAPDGSIRMRNTMRYVVAR